MNSESNVCAYIEEATIDILKKKELKDITVIEVIKKAGVCRASFYRHYADLEDVLRSYLSSFESYFLSKNKEKKNELLNDTFKKIYEMRSIFEIFLSRKLYTYISEFFYNVTYKSIINLNVLNNRYQPYFFAGASSFVILAWMKNNFEETPEAMTKMFIKSLKGY